MQNRYKIQVKNYVGKSKLFGRTFLASVVDFGANAGLTTPWRPLGDSLTTLSDPPGGVRGGKLLRGYTFHVYLSTGLTRRSLQRGGFNGYAVIPPTPGDPLRTPLGIPRAPQERPKSA